jgi:hypothetical protein
VKSALAAAALAVSGCGAIGLTPKAAPTTAAAARAPAFTLPANDGTKVTVNGTHPTALVFYRGFW